MRKDHVGRTETTHLVADSSAINNTHDDISRVFATMIALNLGEANEASLE